MHHNLEAIKTAENLERYCEQHLTKRGPRNYNCPICGSGTKDNKSAAFKLSGNGRWKCFSCGNGGDVLDLIGHVEGIQGEEARIRRAAEIFAMNDDLPAEGMPTRAASAMSFISSWIQPS